MKGKIGSIFLGVIGAFIVFKSLLQEARIGVTGVLVPARVKRN